jgi:broad specificity phosphatase PhoE
VGDLILLRHGQTEWSRDGRHTSVTDLPLTAEGEVQAASAKPALSTVEVAAVLSSPRRRARHTAELAGLTVSALDDDLVEWDYGDYEGLTTAQIRERRPGWDLWRDGCPGGESPEQVGARLDRVLRRARALAEGGDVVLAAHGHCLRVAGARWVGLPPGAGALLRLDTARLSTLGYEHGRPVLLAWNSPAAG